MTSLLDLLLISLVFRCSSLRSTLFSPISIISFGSRAISYLTRIRSGVEDFCSTLSMVCIHKCVALKTLVFDVIIQDLSLLSLYFPSICNFRSAKWFQLDIYRQNRVATGLHFRPFKLMGKIVYLGSYSTGGKTLLVVIRRTDLLFHFKRKVNIDY